MPFFRLPRNVIFGNTLECVDDHVYLWASISHDLCWEKHCNKISKEANKTLGLLRRTLSSCSKEVKSRVYQALIRPQLEYAAEAWNPYNITTTDRLEHIKRAVARFVHHDYRRTTSIRMEVASSRPDHLPTLSAAKTSKLSLLVKSPYDGEAADAGNATPSFCFSVPAMSKPTTLTMESLWIAPTETAKHHILAIDEAS